MATVAPSTSLHAPHSTSSPSRSSPLERMTSRKLFGRSRKQPTASNGGTVFPSSNDETKGHPRPANDDVFSSRDTNMSTSALSTTSTASRTSRFFRRFGRQKAPPVPSLPPALVLDLDAGTAVPRTTDATDASTLSGSADTVYKIQRQPTTPTAAAAIIADTNAAHAAAETVPKPRGVQRRKMLDAMANARLDVVQTRDLVRMCGLQIRERGLDTSGLFRPFRIAESLDRVHHMIQLFLLSIDVNTYSSVFQILPENALDRFGGSSSAGTTSTQLAQSKVAQEELDKELRYASPHDVVSVMKWGLRHMRLRTSDFNSKDSDEWYDSFVSAERQSSYHPRSIADLLHPKLPQATAELLSEVLDLMASVAAHSSSNHMPAAALCKVLGFWLFGRIGVAHPPPTVDELLVAVRRATRMVEHLLMAHIRSQAAVTFSMPLRLTELVQRYPYIKEGEETPSLPPAFASRPVPTLRVDVRSDNLIVSQAKPRSPSSTLADAIDASISHSDSSEVWTEIVSQLSGDGSSRAYELLIDEHVRILRQVDRELADANEESAESTTPTRATATSNEAPPSTAQIKAIRRRSQSLSDLRPNLTFIDAPPLPPLHETTSHGSSTPKPHGGGTPRRKPVPLLPGDEVEEVTDQGELFMGGLEPSASWRSFSEEGFGIMSTASSDLSLSEFDLKPSLPSRRSHRSLYRTKSSASGGSRVRPPTAPSEAEPAKVVTHTITSVKMVEEDTSLAIVWQDQLRDASPACRLPQMLMAQLKEGRWLLVGETVVPPRPPTPEMRGEEVERRSIFAPSMRSVRMRLRRVSTVIGARRRGGGEDV